MELKVGDKVFIVQSVNASDDYDPVTVAETLKIIEVEITGLDTATYKRTDPIKYYLKPVISWQKMFVGSKSYRPDQIFDTKEKAKAELNRQLVHLLESTRIYFNEQLIKIESLIEK